MTSSALTVSAFLGKHLEKLSETYDIYLLANATETEVKQHLPARARFFSMPIRRKISPAQDVIAATCLVRIFNDFRVAAVLSVGPKAGLLTALAAKISRVPVRIHWFTGQVWSVKKGPLRLLLKLADKVIVQLNSKCLVDSHGQRDFLIAEKIGKPESLVVLGQGSISGVDTQKFRSNPNNGREVRSNFLIPLQAIVVAFLGRITSDKGILDLAHALARIGVSPTYPTHVIWIGPDEEGLMSQVSEVLEGSAVKSHAIGKTSKPEYYLAAADLLCLPSYREGFGTSVIEAASMGIPAVATNIYGLKDAVVDGLTGILVAPKETAELSFAIQLMIESTQLRARMGQAALNRARESFSHEKIGLSLLDFIEAELYFSESFR